MNGLDILTDRYGADPAGLIAFDSDDNPALLPYATLTDARRRDSTADLSALVGVYEWQSNPLMFLVDGDMIDGDQPRLSRVRRRIALRGDTPYLGVIETGRLIVHQVALESGPIDGSRIDAPVAEGIVLPYLANERPRALAARKHWISEIILGLLNAALKDLIAAGINHGDAISLAGRALFARFLCDRDLMPPGVFEPGEQHRLFDDPHKAARTSAWLDTTFNGDFLPLTPGLPERMSAQACKPLADIMRRAPAGRLYLGWEQKWDYLDFSQIPVGVLSQAYEGYLRRHRAGEQKKQSGYYTPRPIAEVLVRGALAAQEPVDRTRPPRVLDPAVGGGVFLITAFRQLVAERWAASGVRPDTRTLREILYTQLTGFDIDEAALRFAALGLYLSAIELDPSPEPVTKLRFDDNLRDRVLWKVGDLGETNSDARLGSLGPAVGEEHAGRYDVVVGNPPWTGAGRLKGWPKVLDRIAHIAKERLGPNYPSPPLPNEVPDLAFLWRAMEWCCDDGRIALALSARMLFQQGDGMPEARAAIFSALDITGVVNGADLRKTNVWPGISAPFCLLFARNRVPPPGSGFRFLSPRLEQGLNRAGVMRVDPTSAEIVSARQIVERPTILKTLFRGTRLDLELISRIEAKGYPTLKQYWRELFPSDRGGSPSTGNGYQRLRPSSRIRKGGDGLPGVPADYLNGLPDLGVGGIRSLAIDVSMLKPFRLARLHDPRPRSLFRAPLAIVQEAPPVARRRISAAVSTRDIVYNESYYGYSAHGHPLAQQLTRYVALFLQSNFSLWHALVTSGKFAVERDAIEKETTIDQIPIPPLAGFQPEDMKRIDLLFEELAADNRDESWSNLDTWVFSLFGLQQRNVQSIEDTLACNLPFSANQKLAQEQASADEVSTFSRMLEEELRPWAEPLGADLVVAAIPSQQGLGPWNVLRVSAVEAGGQAPPTDDRKDWEQVIRLADRMAASEIVAPVPAARSILIARLQQRRYWTSSQARLLAERIVWEHLDDLGGGSRT
jgi:hypothetical protein